MLHGFAPRKVPSTSAADGTLLLLLGLNLLLLAFFILLNSMATRGAHHASDVIARVKEGYAVAGTYRGPDADAPGVPLAAWKQGTLGKIQGVVQNRLQISSVPLEADATRLEMLVPTHVLFDGTSLLLPDAVKDVQAAAGLDARIRWVLEGPETDVDMASERLVALVQAGARAEMRTALDTVVRVIVEPGDGTAAERGGQVQRVGAALGADVQGVRHE